MAGDMLTNLLNSGDVEKTLCFTDFYIVKWQDEVAKNCDSQTAEGQCRLTDKSCSYRKCYRRSAFHVNY